MSAATASSLATNPVQAITISFWIRTPATGGMPVAHTEFTSWYTYIPLGGQFQWTLYTTGGNIGLQTTRPVADDNWHLVVCTWDGLSGDHAARIYLDGVLDTISAPLTGTIIPASSQLTLGSGGTGYYFTGTLDDARLYGRALNAAEVSAIYTGGADGDISF